MKAAVMEAFGAPLRIQREWPDSECGPKDVVLEVKACGVCRSDYTIWQGGLPWMGIVPPLPAVIGHEYCGVVEEVGSEVEGVARGDRVVSPFGHGCGACDFCAAGHENVCANLNLPGCTTRAASRPIRRWRTRTSTWSGCRTRSRSPRRPVWGAGSSPPTTGSSTRRPSSPESGSRSSPAAGSGSPPWTSPPRSAPA